MKREINIHDSLSSTSLTWKNWGGWILFVFLPIGLLGIACDSALQNLRKSLVQEAQYSLNESLRSLVVSARDIDEVKARFHLRAGTVVPEPSSEILFSDRPGSGSDSVILQELAEYLRTGQFPVAEKKAQWLDLLGWELDLAGVREKPGTPLEVVWGRSRAFLIWDWVPPSSSDGAKPRAVRAMLMKPSAKEAVLLENIRAFTQVHGGAGGLLHVKNRHWRGTHGVRRSSLTWCSRRAVHQAWGWLDRGKTLMMFQSLPGKQVLFLQRAFPQQWWFDVRPRLWGFWGVFLLAGTLFYPRVFRSVPNWSVRNKFLGIFLYVLGFPLLGAAVLSMNVLEDRGQIQRQETQAEAREMLMSFDAGFVEEEKWTSRFLKNLYRHPLLQSGDYQGFSQIAESLLESGKIDFLVARDWKGEPCLEKAGRFNDPGFRRITEMSARRVIQQAQGGLVEKIMKQEWLVAWTMIETPNLGFLNFMRKPLTLHLFHLGDRLFYLHWQVGIPEKNKTAFLLVGRYHDQLVRHYLERNLIRNRRFPLLVRETSNGRWFPDSSVSSPSMNGLVETMRQAGEEQSGLVEWNGKPFLAVCVAGLRLTNLDLVALIPRDLLIESRLALEDRICWCFLAALIIGLTGAWLLVNGLLTPVREVGRGIVALRNKEFTHRISHSGEDELGRLASAFNRLIETAEEMSVARVVQESLIPNLVPVLPGYDLAWKCRMSNALGGDYLDCFPLPENRLVFLVGDVSGHGVSSALVMAMAKSVVFLHFSEGGTPETLMPRLNRALFQLTLQKQMMTFCFGFLDAGRHEGFVIVAGNPFPYVYIPGETRARTIGKGAYPLGSKAEGKFPAIPLTFSPGASILFYTDGLVEALNQAGEPYGYDRLQIAVERFGPLTAVEQISFLSEDLDHHIGGVPLADDLSLLVLKRKEVS